MHVTHPLSHPARAVLASAVAATALSLAPVVAQPASAAPAVVVAEGTESAECLAARTALAQARAAQRTARATLLKARTALRNAKAAGSATKVRVAKKAVSTATVRYRARTTSVYYRGGRMSYACAAPTSAAKAKGAGKTLALLALADGLPIGAIGLDQLTALLDRFLPGVSEDLTDAQLTALLAGFNAVAGSGGVAPLDAITLLSSAFGPAEITALLGGLAGPELIAELAGHILGQLGGLGGGLPLPGDFDPTDVLETLTGLFGELDPAQLGQLLALVSAAVGGGSTFDLGQLTGLLDTLVPGLSDQLDPAVLTALLGGLNGGGLDAGTLANLLGGAFSVEQLTSVLGGTASTALVGEVIAQVMAQLGTLGGGAFELPAGLDLEALTSLVATVTDLLDALTGGGVLPVICGIIPLPGLCP